MVNKPHSILIGLLLPVLRQTELNYGTIQKPLGFIRLTKGLIRIP